MNNLLTKKQVSALFLIILSAYIGYLNMGYLQVLISMPSPIYGGDYYYQMGNIYHFMQGGSFMESSSLYHALPTYAPIYSYIVALIANTFDISAFEAMKYSSVFFTIVSVFLWFFLFKKLFKENYPIIFIGLIFVAFQNSIILKYTDFAIAIHIPLFLMALYYFIYKRNIYTAALLGLVYGLSALTYTIMFVGVTLLLIMLFTYEIVDAWKGKALKSYFQTHYLTTITVIVVALPISLIYWYEPIFVNHLHMYYNRAKLDFLDFGLATVQIGFFKNTFNQIFSNFSSFQNTLFTLLHISAFVIFFLDKSKERFFVSGYFIASLLIIFSYLLTEPILGTNFIPKRLSLFFLNSSLLLLKLYALHYLFLKLKVDERYKTLIILGLGIYLLINSHTAFENRKSGKWYQRGTKPMNPIFQNLGTYLREHTTANDTILTTKELGFALNAVSGNKLISGRWAHNGSPYTDLSQRDIDLAIILYGNDEKKRDSLIKKYNVSYLFWSNYWINSEYMINKQGKIVNTFDPLIAFNTPLYRNQLIANEIAFSQRIYWLDPSVRKVNVKKFDTIVVGANNYRSFRSPWHKGLNKRLTKVWNIGVKGRETAALYRIDQ
jgi:hypothetical protein